MADIPLGSCEKIIQTQDIMALCNETITEVRSQKTGPAGDKNAFVIMDHFRNALTGASPLERH